jgi:L-arabinose isomerase
MRKITRIFFRKFLRTGDLTMTQARIGLLAFYIELYDQAVPAVRPRMNRFYDQIAAALGRQGIQVLQAPVCRLQSEFAAAVRKFEKGGADALVTLHLAYSPSLESAAVLAKTALPVIVLDTTPTFAYGPDQDPGDLMFNHGIHGVQDMCNLLIRNGKQFKIEAGHWQKSDVLKRVADGVNSARMAAAMRRARVGRIGEPFKGMGDFAVPPSVLKQTLGVTTVPESGAKIKKILTAIRPAEIQAELAASRRNYVIKGLTEESLRRSVHVGLAVRRWIEQEHLTALTVNFLAVTRASGLPTVPFLEACQGMARGLGYAGEGDVLTAALVGALASVYLETTFTEMFCPDWKGNRVFLSHMGEVNPRLLSGKPRLSEMPFKFTDALPPARVTGCLRGGPAVFVNLAPLPDNRYRLIVTPVLMESVKGRDRSADSVHGWFTPPMRVADFLAQYSRLGGTHHAALVYGDAARAILGFGECMGWETVLL